MNYITEIGNFYDCLETKPLSTNAICLWHGLMITAKKTGWIDIFTVASSTLQLRTALNKKAVERARIELASMGYIDWIKQGGNQAAMYQLRSLAIYSSPEETPSDAQATAQIDAQDDVQPDAQIDVQPDAINKQDKTKQNK